MDIDDILDGFKGAKPSQHINYKLIPVNRIKANIEGAILFNKLIDYVHSIKGISKYEKTPSGGISCRGGIFYPSYNINVLNAGVELVLLSNIGCYRIIFTNIDLKGKVTMYGSQALKIFKKYCEEYKIDLESYAIENGVEVKAEIEKPKIYLTSNCIPGYTYDNVHHIDTHSSWPHHFSKAYPEFRPMMEHLFSLRNKKKKIKDVMNLSIGMFQSEKMTHARWAHFAKAAINGCNRQIEEISENLRKNGRKILAYNTDGIWYQGEIYHGEGEGDKLGEWYNDYINTIWRARSAGAYEFLDDQDKINIRLRGNCELDKYKSRDDWEWDDLFTPQAYAQAFYYNNELEMIEYEEVED